MEITWLGHSCFRLRARDVSILTDPYNGDTLGRASIDATADVVTVSHDDPHHAHIKGLGGNPRVLTSPGEYEIGGAMVWGVRTNRRAEGDEQARSRNVSYMIKVEDLSICHLGNLGGDLTAEQLTFLKDADVLLIPVGGHSTINAAQAAKVVAQIEPRIILPMHYALDADGENDDLDGVERFCKEMGAADLTPQNRLNVTASNLPSEPTVVLLERR